MTTRFCGFAECKALIFCRFVLLEEAAKVDGARRESEARFAAYVDSLAGVLGSDGR